MRKLIAISVLLSLALGLCGFQYVTAGFNKGASSLPTVTKIGQMNFATASPYTITASGNASVGDTVMLICSGQGANAGTHYTFQVGDSVSNTWTYPTVSTNTNLQYLDTTDSNAIQVPYAAAITSAYVSGTTTVTVTDGVSDGSSGGCDLFDIKGLLSSPFDQSVGSAGPFTTSPATASLTPSQQPEVVIAIFATSASGWSAYGNIIGSAATGLDHRTGGAANPPDINIEWRRVTALTAGTGTMTVASAGDNYGNYIFSLKSN